jgi:hypothetical protein
MLVANKPKTDLSDIVKEICKERLDWQAAGGERDRKRSHSGSEIENEEELIKEMERERKNLER